VYRLLQILLAIGLVGMTLLGPAGAALAGGPVGNGTPASCNETTFKAALVGGGAVTFACGGPKTIQLTSPAAINQDTTIDGGSVITLTGNLATQLFSVGPGTNLTLKNITLDKGYANHHVGGAIINAGSLALDNVSIQNSVADNDGGAIWTSGPVSIRNSRLHDNNGKDGGAIYEQNPRPLTIDNSTFTHNTALDPHTGSGGAIALGPGAQLTMTGGSLINNFAPLEGGALNLAAGASATFAPGAAGGTSLSFNSVLGYGGAISNNGGRLVLEGASLDHNQTLTDSVAIGFGGAIDGEGAMLVHNSLFNSNQARFGGAVFVGGVLYNARADIQHTHFTGNQAAQNGGALYANTVTTTVTITDSSFEFNIATFGGGLSRTDARLSLSRSSITDNTAMNGGGLALQALPDPTDGPFVEIHDSTISGNLSTSGFGGGINNFGLLDLVNVTVGGNHQGLYNTSKPGSSAVARLENTVLDNLPGGNCGGDGTLPSSAGFNYSTDASCGLAGTGDQEGLGLNAMLGPLTNADSFTSYQMPQPGSPLINQIANGCSATDQRFALRVGQCDIGAIEFGGLLPRIFVPLIKK